MQEPKIPDKQIDEILKNAIDQGRDCGVKVTIDRIGIDVDGKMKKGWVAQLDYQDQFGSKITYESTSRQNAVGFLGSMIYAKVLNDKSQQVPPQQKGEGKPQ